MFQVTDSFTHLSGNTLGLCKTGSQRKLDFGEKLASIGCGRKSEWNLARIMNTHADGGSGQQ